MSAAIIIFFITTLFLAASLQLEQPRINQMKKPYTELRLTQNKEYITKLVTILKEVKSRAPKIIVQVMIQQNILNHNYPYHFLMNQKD